MSYIAAPCSSIAYASLTSRRGVRSNKPQYVQTSYHQANTHKLISAKLSNARHAAATSKSLTQTSFMCGESQIRMRRAAARSERQVLSVSAGLLKVRRPSHLLLALLSDEKMKVLVVGGGGREHALAWKLSLSPFCEKLFCAPGNPGIAEEANITCLKGDKLNVDDQAAVRARSLLNRTTPVGFCKTDWCALMGVVSFCKENNIGLIVVGPEVLFWLAMRLNRQNEWLVKVMGCLQQAPLVAGLSDTLRKAGFKVFGPSAAAAQLEGSKAFMKVPWWEWCADARCLHDGWDMRDAALHSIAGHLCQVQNRHSRLRSLRRRGEGEGLREAARRPHRCQGGWPRRRKRGHRRHGREGARSLPTTEQEKGTSERNQREARAWQRLIGPLWEYTHAYCV
eukprot:1195404-Prorocentrum_minimum.AAC.6